VGSGVDAASTPPAPERGPAPDHRVIHTEAADADHRRMYANLVFEFRRALGASLGVNRAEPGGPLQNPGRTFEQRSLSRVEPRR